jgi:hypothetical protein
MQTYAPPHVLVPTAAAGSTKARKLLKASVVLLFVVGGLSVATGAWFVADDFPFTGPDDKSGKFGMTKGQIETFNPHIVSNTLHAWDQVGFLSISYGLFIIGIAHLGIRRGNPVTWVIGWLGGIPAQIGGPIELRYNLETGDAGQGDVLVWLVLALFLVAMLLPAKQMIAAWKAIPPTQR